jgi:hypothetical protein
MKLNKYETTTIEITTSIVGLLLAFIFLLIRTTIKTLHKAKRWLFRLAIVILLFNSALTAVQQVAYAPKADASEFKFSAKPLTEREQIVNYIHEVFGKDADKAFLVLSCENKRLSPNAVNTAGNYPVGSRDIGVFQINEHWQAVQGKFLFNWKINIEIAHQLYVENGNSFKLWTCGRNYGI